MQDSYATQSGNIKGYYDSSNSYLDTGIYCNFSSTEKNSRSNNNSCLQCYNDIIMKYSEIIWSSHNILIMHIFNTMSQYDNANVF